ncbi:MAG TPA: hypothetical protein VGY31_01630 [Terriglobia bacterium]|nr:hypothetical protein [Terriglobia bacterium]
MQMIGYSTGALAYENFRRGVEMLRKRPIHALELSALREAELRPLLDGLGELNLSQFSYISFHAPSAFSPQSEEWIVERLGEISRRGWPIVLHPDAVHNYALWRPLGSALLVENMDRRKPSGRTVPELEHIFNVLPEACLCFDLGHARQVDTTMTTAHLILKRFADRLRQVHLSEVNTNSKHDRLSYGAILAYQKVAALVPKNVPVILETPVTEQEIDAEIKRATEALTTKWNERKRQMVESASGHALTQTTLAPNR